MATATNALEDFRQTLREYKTPPVETETVPPVATETVPPVATETVPPVETKNEALEDFRQTLREFKTPPVETGTGKAPTPEEKEDQNVTWLDKVSNAWQEFSYQIAEAQQVKSYAQEGAARILSKTARDVAQTPVTLAKLGATVVDIAAGTDVVKSVEESNIGKAYTSAIENLSPVVIETGMNKDEYAQYINEKIASEILGYLTVAGLGKKLAQKGFDVLVSKFGNDKARKIAKEMNKQIGGPKSLGPGHVAEKISRTAVGGLGSLVPFTAIDIQYRPDEEFQFMDGLLKVWEDNPDKLYGVFQKENWEDNFLTGKPLEIIETISEHLRIHPEDADPIKLFKQYGDSALFYGVGSGLMGLLNLITHAAKGGIKGSTGLKEYLKNRKVRKDNLKEAIKLKPNFGGIVGSSPSKNKIVTSSTIQQNPAGKVSMINKVTEKIGNLNTSAGRELTSARSMPKELDTAAIKRINAEKAYNTEVKYQLVKLLRLKRKLKVSDDDFKLYMNQNTNNNLPAAFKAEVDALNSTVAANESRIFRMLGVEDGAVGVRTDGQKFYYTKQYESVLNPSWSKNVKKGLEKIKGKFKTADDTDFIAMLHNAKEYFRKKGMTDDVEIENTISLLLSNVRREDVGILRNIFEGLELKGMGSQAAKGLRARKTIDPEIRALLGEITNPMKKFESTLITQNKILSELNWLKDIEKYALANIGTDVKMGGLFPFLPTMKAPFRRGLKSKIENPGDLSKLVEDTYARLGGNASGSEIMKDLYTSETMLRYIDRGISLYDPKNMGGDASMAAMRRSASVFQAAETTLDPFAYALNTTGAVNALVQNGHLFIPANYKAAVSSVKTMAQQVRRNDPAAVELLATLKRVGVIEQDVTGEMIAANVRMFGSNPGSLPTRLFTKTMEATGRAYGQPDMWAKLIAFHSELEAAKKIFPFQKMNMNRKEYNSYMIEESAKLVRDTMPTYGSSLPVARRLARVPVVGNYLLFPTEVVRTHKNTVKNGLIDVGQGLKNRNGRQIARGVRRLTGSGAVIFGMDAIFNTNNEFKGINNNHKKAMQLLAAPWGKGSKNWHVTGFVKDMAIVDKITRESITKQFPKKDWEKIRKPLNMKKNEYDKYINERLKYRRANVVPYISTKTVSSMSLDATDYLKAVSRLGLAATGRLVGIDNKEMAEQEIDKAAEYALATATAPYLSPKRLVGAAMNAWIGRRKQSGKKIYDEAVGAEFKDNFLKFWDEIGRGFGGGAQKAVREEILATDAKVLLGEGNEMRASGFPLTPQRFSKFALLGSLERTRNIELEIGYNLSKDIKAIDELKNNWKNEIRQLPYKERTEEDVNDIINLYDGLQSRRFEGMRNLKEKVDIFNKIDFTIKTRGGKERETTIGKEGLLYEILSSKYTKNLHPDIASTIFTGVAKEAEGGLFLPTPHSRQPFDGQLITTALEEKGFSRDQAKQIWNGLIKTEKKWYDTSLTPKGN